MPAVVCRMPVIWRGGKCLSAILDTNQVVPQKNDIAANAQYPLCNLLEFKNAAKKKEIFGFIRKASDGDLLKKGIACYFIRFIPYF